MIAAEAQRDCSVKAATFDHDALMCAPPLREAKPQFRYDWKLFPMAPDLALLSSRTHLRSKPTGGARNWHRSVHLRMLKQVLKNKKKRRSKQKPEAVLILFPAAFYMAVMWKIPLLLQEV